MHQLITVVTITTGLTVFTASSPSAASILSELNPVESSFEMNTTRVGAGQHGLMVREEDQPNRDTISESVQEAGHLKKAIELGMDAIRFINQQQVDPFRRRAQEAIAESQQADLKNKKPGIQEVVRLFNESIMRAERGEAKIASQLASRAVDTLKRMNEEMAH